MRDTSLDDFIGEDEGDDTDDVDGANDEGENEGPSGSGAVDTGGDVDGAGVDEEVVEDMDEVQPAVSTYEWTPDGASCAECDVVVDRRWRTDGELVCAECKDW